MHDLAYLDSSHLDFLILCNIIPFFPLKQRTFRYTCLLMAVLLPEDDRLRILVLQAQEGDSEAFSEVYQHFFTPVYRYVSFRVPSDMVEDIVAEIFVKAWEKLGSYRPMAGVPFGAWLFRIARHNVIDHYRGEIEVAEMPEDIEDHDDFNRADARTNRNEVLRIVREAMEKLPRRYREVLELAYVAELPHSDISRVLRLREGAVRILKLRALRKLASHLPPEMRNGA